MTEQEAWDKVQNAVVGRILVSGWRDDGVKAALLSVRDELLTALGGELITPEMFHHMQDVGVIWHEAAWLLPQRQGE